MFSRLDSQNSVNGWLLQVSLSAKSVREGVISLTGMDFRANSSQKSVETGVARWFVFKHKIPIWVNV
jgi:hypothetical protein